MVLSGSDGMQELCAHDSISDSRGASEGGFDLRILIFANLFLHACWTDTSILRQNRAKGHLLEKKLTKVADGHEGQEVPCPVLAKVASSRLQVEQQQGVAADGIRGKTGGRFGAPRDERAHKTHDVCPRHENSGF